MYTLLMTVVELDERMRDLKDELQSFEGEEYDENNKRKTIDALKRMESWNLFSDTVEVTTQLFWLDLEMVLINAVHFTISLDEE